MRSIVQFLAPASFLLAAVAASPLQSPNTPAIALNLLSKRTDPNTAGDFEDDDPDLLRVEQAFKDAIELCSYVISAPSAGIDSKSPIFTKYFDEGDRAAVRSVFNTVLGNPQDPTNPDPTGSDLLGSILVAKTDVEKLCPATKDRVPFGYMTNQNTDNPYIIPCPPVYTHLDISAITCDSLGDNVSYKMMPLGGFFLHEYMHFEKLVDADVGGPIEDQPGGYGPVNIRKLNKDLAFLNADSYAYYAFEVFWTTICSKDFGDPVKDIDDADPACGDKPCTE